MNEWICSMDILLPIRIDCTMKEKQIMVFRNNGSDGQEKLNMWIFALKYMKENGWISA